MDRYLVTGGAGFIGSNYVRGLLNGKWGSSPGSVVVLDSLTYAGNLANLSSVQDDSRFRFTKGSILDNELLDALLPNIDVIVNFAAESHVDRSISGARVFTETNALGTAVLLEAAVRNKVPRVVHVSTDEVYGSVEHGASHEDDILLPNSPYAASKASSDLVARSFFRTYGLDVRVTRCSNNFGPFQNREKVIPLFITNLICGEQLPVYGSGMNRRDWLHVDDHCEAIELVVHGGRAGEVYNIGGGTEMTNIDLAHLILGHFGLDERMISFVADRPGHDLRYCVDYQKITDELGYRPSKSLEHDLPEVVKWYKTNRGWWDSATRLS